MNSQFIAETYRFCPRCGEPNPNPGCTPFTCEKCGFYNYFGPVTAVGGIVVNERVEMLFIRRAREPGKGKWGLPGGFVDTGETAEQAVAREIREEVGLTVVSTEFLTTAVNEYHLRGICSPVIDLFYVVSVQSDTQLELAVDEVDHYEWSRPMLSHLENMAFESNRLAVELWARRVSHSRE